MPAHPYHRHLGCRQEFNELLRGTAGGFLFGIPLLYTMEVWWIGSAVEPPMMLAAIVAMLAVAFVLNLTEGFRTHRVETWSSAVSDTVNAVAIGLISVTLMLILLRQITWQTQLRETLGKVIFESVPFALGAALSNQFLQPVEAPPPRARGSDPPWPGPAVDRFFPENNLNETLADIGATLIGALIVGFSIAPTEEVPMVVGGVQGPWLLGLVMASLVISYIIVFEANFTRQSQRQMQRGLFQSPISETIMAYLVSLIAAAMMLVFFQQIGWGTPWDVALRYTLVLGFPATIGGAAGRLAL